MSARNAWLAALLVVAVSTVHAQGAPKPFRIPARSVADVAPFEWQQAGPEALGLSRERVAALPALLTSETPQVKVLLVVRDNQLMFEYHRDGYGPDDLHNVASVTKSVMATLIGLALQDGIVKGLDQKAVALLPPAILPPADARFQEVTVRHLLTMRSGLHRKGPGGVSSAALTLKQQLTAAPGTSFNYNSSANHLLSVILSQQTGAPARQYAERKLFAPLGISGYNWFGDDDGHSYGSHDLYLKPRDMAKIGQLYLQGGVWQGRRILDAGYAADAVSKLVPTGLADAPDYGYLWWPTHSLADTPAYSAAGFGGQYIFVVPAQSLVVVALSDQDEGGRTAAFIRRLVLPAVWKPAQPRPTAVATP
ncbi:serine hydrolase domain-containing protein [Caenimonas sedimenti]|uniref:serine hydrolase domain-containing protein n=1 Tax=Caenimonas sedimenti TaxID=2596921 RepID=UPI0016440053|nr:serine hydrolase [Caenimonas sedimenti]